MQLWKGIVFILVVIFLIWGIYGLIAEKNSLQNEVKDLRSNVQNLKSENNSLAQNIEYFKRPENLIKELKSQFNYKEAGEKLIIVVPGATSTTSTAP
ncbi:MAG: septum formation initiator family protein [Patescibacteria group bacterium]